MKNLLFAALLFSVFANAQHYTDQLQVIRIGTNPKIALTGAYEYDSSHLAITFDWVTKFGNGSEVGITAEYVKLDPEFFAGGFQYNKPLIFTNRDGFETLLGAEILFIHRIIAERDENFEPVGNTWIGAKFKAISRYNISDLIDVNLIFAIQSRQDLNILWGEKNYSYGVYFKIGFKFI